ncbi:GORASP2 isoform 7 [Pan troglodytes]|uniref:GORASP2 isoform 6 n=5 Tax=Hominidae TaxID=9604 RepID=A0A2J8VQQ8_PONAB|nr:GORASP2 isoform 7 [Pan troglodytes]PNJ59862.1 GORASP2 isoform 6 [Pongo abelii]
MGSSQSVEIPGGGTEGYHVLRLPKLGRARRQRLQSGDCEGSLCAFLGEGSRPAVRRRGLRRQVLNHLGAGRVA